MSVWTRRPDSPGSYLIQWVVCVVAGSIGWWVSDRDGFGLKPFLTLVVGVTIGLGVVWLLSRRRPARTTDAHPEPR